MGSVIELRETESMGFGVFAVNQIKVGEEITRDPATAFNEASWPAIRQCFFGPYAFMDPKKYPDQKSGFVAWGLATLINHHDEPNAWIETTKENGRLEAVVRASRTIHAGEQIFLRYTNRDDAELYPWYEKRPA